MRFVIITDTSPGDRLEGILSILTPTAHQGDQNFHKTALTIGRLIITLPLALFGVDPRIVGQAFTDFMQKGRVVNYNSIVEKVQAHVQEEYKTWASTLYDTWLVGLDRIGQYVHLNDRLSATHALQRFVTEVLETPADAIKFGMDEQTRRCVASIIFGHSQILKYEGSDEIAIQVARQMGVKLKPVWVVEDDQLKDSIVTA